MNTYTTNVTVTSNILDDVDGTRPDLAGREWWAACMTVVPDGYPGPEGLIYGSLTSAGWSREGAVDEIIRYLEQALADLRAARDKGVAT